MAVQFGDHGLQHLIADVLQIAIEFEAGSAGMTTAAEGLGEPSHVDAALAAEADPYGTWLFRFHYKYRHLNGGNLEWDIDEIFGIWDTGLGLFEILSSECHDGESAAFEEFEGLLGAGCEGNAFCAFVLVHGLVDAIGLDAAFHKGGGEAESVGAGVGKLEPTGIADEGDIECGGDSAVDGDVPDIEQLGDDFAGGGGILDDEFDIGPIFLSEVVVDDDFLAVPAGDTFFEAGQLRPGSRIDDEEGIKGVDGIGLGPFFFDVVIGDVVFEEDKGVFSWEMGEQEDFGVDADAPETEGQSGGGTEGVAVGSDVGGDENAFGVGKCVDDLAIGVFHGGMLTGEAGGITCWRGRSGVRGSWRPWRPPLGDRRPFWI